MIETNQTNGDRMAENTPADRVVEPSEHEGELSGTHGGNKRADAETTEAVGRGGGDDWWGGVLLDEAVLGLDYGLRRIGMAIKPAGQRQALPLRVIEAEPPARAMEAIHDLLRERGVSAVVVGLPFDSDPHQARLTRKFVRKLREGVRGVRWHFVDESDTTAEAHELRMEAGVSARGRKGRSRPVDDRAAAVILESFLSSPTEEYE